MGISSKPQSLSDNSASQELQALADEAQNLLNTSFREHLIEGLNNILKQLIEAVSLEPNAETSHRDRYAIEEKIKNFKHKFQPIVLLKGDRRHANPEQKTITFLVISAELINLTSKDLDEMCIKEEDFAALKEETLRLFKINEATLSNIPSFTSKRLPRYNVALLDTNQLPTPTQNFQEDLSMAKTAYFLSYITAREDNKKQCLKDLALRFASAHSESDLHAELSTQKKEEVEKAKLYRKEIAQKCNEKMIKELNSYIDRRGKEGEYKGFLRILNALTFGLLPKLFPTFFKEHSKETKMAAAEAVLQLAKGEELRLTDPQQAAATAGKLLHCYIRGVENEDELDYHPRAHCFGLGFFKSSIYYQRGPIEQKIIAHKPARPGKSL